MLEDNFLTIKWFPKFGFPTYFKAISNTKKQNGEKQQPWYFNVMDLQENGQLNLSKSVCL